jgi:diguanylate cyclase (GGDEF)-like protein
LKSISDQFGHAAGNRALCRLAQILTDCCRSVDTAARQGGDEFAVVLPETGSAAATLVARRIANSLPKMQEEPALSASVGVASYPKDAESIGPLLYAADRALYAMKGHRPKAVRVANASFSSSTDSKAEFRQNQSMIRMRPEKERTADKSHSAHTRVPGILNGICR